MEEDLAGMLPNGSLGEHPSDPSSGEGGDVEREGEPDGGPDETETEQS